MGLDVPEGSLGSLGHRGRFTRGSFGLAPLSMLSVTRRLPGFEGQLQMSTSS